MVAAIALVLVLGCRAVPEAAREGTDQRDEALAAWELAGGATLLRDARGGIAWHGQEGAVPWADEIAGIPALSADGARVVYAERTGPGSVLVARDAAEGWHRRVLVGEGTPDRPALSEDAERVAFAWNRGGLASLWVVDFAGGAPRQVTNIGLERAERQPGAPPAGYVPPPHTGPPRFEGPNLVWEAPDGPHRVALP